MKTSFVFFVALVASVAADTAMDTAAAMDTEAMMNLTAIVTRDCIQTPTPQSMSGVYKSYVAATVEECRQRCVGTNCMGFSWQAPSACTAFDWISMSFDTTDPVSSWRCRAQLVQENALLPGLDFAKVYTPTADQCSYKCEATQGCYAYSWSNADGGTCSLKSDKPSTFAGPYDGSVVSGEVYKCSRPYYTNVEGTVLASVPGAVWSDCCAICRRSSGCEGFTWSENNGGTCALKAKLTIGPRLYNIFNYAYVSGFMLGSTPTSGPDQCTETDTPQVFAGTNQEYSADTPEECREICLMTNCVAFSMGTFPNRCKVSLWTGLSVKAFTGRSWRCRRQLPQENGNYVGLTIDNAPTPDADRCSYQCDVTSRCQAYSWTKANNGTCWLKSNKPLTVAEPFDGSVVSGESYKCTSPQFDQDVIGTDLTSVLRPRWSDCCGVCRRTSGCDAFSWSSANGGTCWLKTKTNRSKTKVAVGVVSGYMFPSPTPQLSCVQVEETLRGVQRYEVVADGYSQCERVCAFYNCVGFKTQASIASTCVVFLWIGYTSQFAFNPEDKYYRCRAQIPQENVDYPGLDLSNSPAATADLCSYLCEDTRGCFAYTWTRANGGVCYMKTGKPSVVSGPYDGSLVSGEAFTGIIPDFDSEIVGFDLASVQRGSWPECVSVCRRTSGCKAFSWSTKNNGTCMLKTDGSSWGSDAVGIVTVRVSY